jgi:uncharacterized protein (DUF2236 family)
MRSFLSEPIRPLLGRCLDAFAGRMMFPDEDGLTFDFSKPAGEPALVSHDSLSWCVFKNPLSLFIGGVAAVILELAEPAVRTGVWEHSSFRTAPVRRLQRTGMAAMVTVYGPRSAAEKMIAAVVRRHGTIAGTTPSGEYYTANDTALLNWVQATAAFGFTEAYSHYVSPLSDTEISRLFAEGREAATLYGAVTAPRSKAEWDELLATMRGRLEPSPIIHEFLGIMKTAPIVPRALRPLQEMAVRAAVVLVPAWVRERIGLGRDQELRPGEAALLRSAGRIADRIALPSAPPSQACFRLGLPSDYLYRHRRRHVR